MCLQLESSKTKIKTAKKDIVVYKIIRKLLNGDYETPYQYYPVEIGKTYRSDLIKEDDTIEIGLHSFKTVTGLKYDKNWLNRSNLRNNIIIVECIIPKGSKYYEGTFGVWNAYSYASNKLTYTNKIID